MSNITPLDALIALGETEVCSAGIPTNANEFATMVYKTDGSPISFSWAEVSAKITELEADYTSKQYKRDRAVAYPSLAEQLDMQYHDNINGTTTWADAIQAVKDKYPKPE